MLKSIKRKVYFHQIKWKTTGNEINSKNAEFLISIIKKLPSIEYKDEYNEIITDIRYDGDWIFGIIAKTKKTDFPFKQNFNDLSLTELDLTDEEGLYYPVHFAVYKGQILISEWNYESFRVASFLNRKINQILKENIQNYNTKKININPIIRTDFKEKLINSKLREIQMDIASSNVDILKDHDSIKEIFKSIQYPQNLILTLGLSIGNKRADEYYNEMDKIKEKVMYILDENLYHYFRKLKAKIKNPDGKIEEINILDDIFKIEKEFIKVDGNAKAISADDAFKKFKEIYQNNINELDPYINNDTHD